jgi:hypothetical protein
MPSGVLAATASRSMSPVARWQRQCSFCARRATWAQRGQGSPSSGAITTSRQRRVRAAAQGAQSSGNNLQPAARASVTQGAQPSAAQRTAGVACSRNPNPHERALGAPLGTAARALILGDCVPLPHPGGPAHTRAHPSASAQRGTRRAGQPRRGWARADEDDALLWRAQALQPARHFAKHGVRGHLGEVHFFRRRRGRQKGSSSKKTGSICPAKPRPARAD